MSIINRATVEAVRGTDTEALVKLLLEMGHEVAAAQRPVCVIRYPGIRITIGGKRYIVCHAQTKPQTHINVWNSTMHSQMFTHEEAGARTEWGPDFAQKT